MASELANQDRAFLNRVMEAGIRLGVVFLLLALCFQIIRPFIIPVVWGVIIAIAGHAGYQRLGSALGDRPRLAAVLFTILMLVVLIVPATMLLGTLVEGARGLATDLSDGTLTIPPPPGAVASWPLIGEPLSELWTLASQNVGEALQEVGPQLKALGKWLLSAAAGAGLGLLQFTVAIIIAGFLLVHTTEGGRTARAILTRLSGQRGADFADLAGATIRSVARGILGVALLQSLLAGLGFMAVELPAAGLWALLCLLLSVAQIGVFPVLIPAVIYVFSTGDNVTGVLFTIWCILVGFTDNVLKPILLGRGVRIPMLVIFVGAIGGFLSMGIIGLFVGSVILALGYKLFLAWLHEQTATGAEAESTAAAALRSESGLHANPGDQ